MNNQFSPVESEKRRKIAEAIAAVQGYQAPGPFGIIGKNALGGGNVRVSPKIGGNPTTQPRGIVPPSPAPTRQITNALLNPATQNPYAAKAPAPDPNTLEGLMYQVDATYPNISPAQRDVIKYSLQRKLTERSNSWGSVYDELTGGLNRAEGGFMLDPSEIGRSGNLPQPEIQGSLEQGLGKGNVNLGSLPGSTPPGQDEALDFRSRLMTSPPEVTEGDVPQWISELSTLGEGIGRQDPAFTPALNLYGEAVHQANQGNTDPISEWLLTNPASQAATGLGTSGARVADPLAFASFLANIPRMGYESLVSSYGGKGLQGQLEALAPNEETRAFDIANMLGAGYHGVKGRIRGHAPEAPPGPEGPPAALPQNVGPHPDFNEADLQAKAKVSRKEAAQAELDRQSANAIPEGPPLRGEVLQQKEAIQTSSKKKATSRKSKHPGGYTDRQWALMSEEQRDAAISGVESPSAVLTPQTPVEPKSSGPKVKPGDVIAHSKTGKRYTIEAAPEGTEVMSATSTKEGPVYLLRDDSGATKPLHEGDINAMLKKGDWRKEKANAVPVESPGQEVLRQEGPQVELPGVDEGNTQPGKTTKQGKGKAKPEVPQEEVNPAALKEEPTGDEDLSDLFNEGQAPKKKGINPAGAAVIVGAAALGANALAGKDDNQNEAGMGLAPVLTAAAAALIARKFGEHAFSPKRILRAIGDAAREDFKPESNSGMMKIVKGVARGWEDLTVHDVVRNVAKEMRARGIPDEKAAKVVQHLLDHADEIRNAIHEVSQKGLAHAGTMPAVYERSPSPTETSLRGGQVLEPPLLEMPRGSQLEGVQEPSLRSMAEPTEGMQAWGEKARKLIKASVQKVNELYPSETPLDERASLDEIMSRAEIPGPNLLKDTKAFAEKIGLNKAATKLLGDVYSDQSQQLAGEVPQDQGEHLSGAPSPDLLELKNQYKTGNLFDISKGIEKGLNDKETMADRLAAIKARKQKGQGIGKTETTSLMVERMRRVLRDSVTAPERLGLSREDVKKAVETNREAYDKLYSKYGLNLNELLTGTEEATTGPSTLDQLGNMARAGKSMPDNWKPSEEMKDGLMKALLHEWEDFKKRFSKGKGWKATTPVLTTDVHLQRDVMLPDLRGKDVPGRKVEGIDIPAHTKYESGQSPTSISPSNFIHPDDVKQMVTDAVMREDPMVAYLAYQNLLQMKGKAKVKGKMAQFGPEGEPLGSNPGQVMALGEATKAKVKEGKVVRPSLFRKSDSTGFINQLEAIGAEKGKVEQKKSLITKSVSSTARSLDQALGGKPFTKALDLVNDMFSAEGRKRILIGFRDGAISHDQFATYNTVRNIMRRLDSHYRTDGDFRAALGRLDSDPHASRVVEDIFDTGPTGRFKMEENWTSYYERAKELKPPPEDTGPDQEVKKGGLNKALGVGALVGMGLLTANQAQAQDDEGKGFTGAASDLLIRTAAVGLTTFLASRKFSGERAFRYEGAQGLAKKIHALATGAAVGYAAGGALTKDFGGDEASALLGSIMLGGAVKDFVVHTFRDTKVSDIHKQMAESGRAGLSGFVQQAVEMAHRQNPVESIGKNYVRAIGKLAPTNLVLKKFAGDGFSRELSMAGRSQESASAGFREEISQRIADALRKTKLSSDQLRQFFHPSTNRVEGFRDSFAFRRSQGMAPRNAVEQAAQSALTGLFKHLNDYNWHAGGGIPETSGTEPNKAAIGARARFREGKDYIEGTIKSFDKDGLVTIDTPIGDVELAADRSYVREAVVDPNTYWPRRILPDVYDMVNRFSGYSVDALTDIATGKVKDPTIGAGLANQVLDIVTWMEKNGKAASKHGAWEALKGLAGVQDLITTDFMKSALDKARVAYDTELPPWAYDYNLERILPSHIDATTSSAELHRAFGPQMEGWLDHLQNMSTEMQDYAKEATRLLMGKDTASTLALARPIVTMKLALNAGSAIIQNGVIGTTLGKYGLANTAKARWELLKGGMNYLSGIGVDTVNALKDPTARKLSVAAAMSGKGENARKVFQEIRRSGVDGDIVHKAIDTHLSSDDASKWLLAPLSKLDQLQRRTAMYAADITAQQALSKLGEPSFQSQESIVSFLKDDLKFSDADIADMKTLSTKDRLAKYSEKARMSAYHAGSIITGLPERGQLSASLARSPWMRAFATLQMFNYVTTFEAGRIIHENIDRVITARSAKGTPEANKVRLEGAYNLARFFAATGIVGFTVDELKDKFYEMLGLDTKKTILDKFGFFGGFTRAVAASGNLGMFNVPGEFLGWSDEDSLRPTAMPVLPMTFYKGFMDLKGAIDQPAHAGDEALKFTNELVGKGNPLRRFPAVKKGLRRGATYSRKGKGGGGAAFNVPGMETPK